jgi:hypothetical protein
MNTTLKGAFAGVLITTGMALGIGLAGPASAMPAAGSSVDPVSDGEAATCAVFDEDFTGNIANDSAVALGVAKAQSEYYSISLAQAVKVTNAQVYTYCPRNWPNLVAVGDAARARSSQSA